MGARLYIVLPFNLVTRFETSVKFVNIDTNLTELSVSKQNKITNIVQTSDGKVGLRSDNEGGNLFFVSPNGKSWEFDAYNDDARLFTNNGVISFTFKKDGDFNTNKIGLLSTVIKNIQNNVTNINNGLKWSGWNSLGSAIGVNFYYRYNAHFVEIRYDGMLQSGKGITGQTIGYTFNSIPSEYKPKVNIMHSISSVSSKSLMIRLYPGNNQYSLTSQDTITTQSEYLCGSFVYGR